MESETYQERPEYAATPEQRLQLVKSIVAMANTKGGEIRIRRIAGGSRGLDPAALDGLVNKYVGPRINGLEAEVLPGGEVSIRVPESDAKPHIVKESGAYEDGTELRHVFHKGQIWVRHSSGSAEATPDDLRQLLYAAAGLLLERVGTQIRQPGFVLAGDELAVPVRLADDPEAILVRADPEITYPHTRNSLANELGQPYPWIAAAVKVLGLEDSAEYAYTDRNLAGHPTHWRYSEAARHRLLEKLAATPDWDPREE